MNEDTLLDEIPNRPLPAGPVVIINVFTPKPGKLDAFIMAQTEALPRLSANFPGWRGSRLHRSLDGTRAVMITVVDSVEDHAHWMESDIFATHREKIAGLIESAESRYFDAVYQMGTI